MFNKILNMFKKAPEELVMGIDEVETELNNKLKDEQEALKELIIKQKSEIERTKTLILERLDVLEAAKLRNNNLLEKEVQFMKGNRVNFLRLNRYFVNELGTVPNTQLIEYHDDFLVKLNKMKKSTARSYSVLQNYFKNETVAIAHALKTLERQIHSVAVMAEGAGLQNIETGIETIDVLKKRMKSAKEAQNNIDKATKNKNKLSEELKKSEKTLEDYKKSKEAEELDLLRATNTKLEHNINALRKKVRDMLATLDKPLKKYEHISMDPGTLREVLKNPVDACINNTKVAEHVMIPLKGALDKLGLDEKRAKKSANAIDKLVQVIPTIKEKLEALEKEKKQTEDKIKKHPAKSKIVKMDENISKLNVELKRTTQKLNALDAPITQEQIDDEKKEIASNATKILGKKIEID